MKKRKIYIAAPLFSEGERAFNERIDAILRDCGHETFLPQREGGCVSDLPEIIEDTQQYTLISLLQENAVPSKYITAPLFIREDLMRYSKYLGDYEEFAISFPNINTITSRWHALDTTEQYFSEHIAYIFFHKI